MDQCYRRQWGPGINIQGGGYPPTELTIPLGYQMEVYDAECIGIMNAAEACLKIATQQQREGITVRIFTDNQAAVHRVSSLQPGPRQDIAMAIASIADHLHKRNNSLRIHWVPGHANVPGNERADQLAKAATTQKQPFLFHTSISYIRRAAKARMIQE
jgi:ribonuclease HI